MTRRLAEIVRLVRRRAPSAEQLGHALCAALLSVACGRSELTVGLSAAAEAGGGDSNAARGGTPAVAGASPTGGAGSSAGPNAWDSVAWDAPKDQLVVYLWTGSPSDTWVVSVAGGGVFHRDHWDGASFTRTLDQSGNPSFEERPVWSAPSGQAFSSSSRSMQRLMPPGWSDWQPAPSCRAIGGTSESDVWCASEGALAHFDGARWTREALGGIHGILALTGEDVWAWGAQGALHFDGVVWSAQLSEPVRCVSASGPRDVWAVQEGNLLHSEGPGTRWTRQNPSGSQISAVWSQSPTNTWIVAAGAAMRWDGSSWSTATLPSSDELLLISGSSQDVWIAGTAMLFHGRATGK